MVQWTAGMIKVYMEDWFFFLAYTPKLFLGDVYVLVESPDFGHSLHV